MITSITVKKIATYDDTGIVISDLKHINFIYGANGTGKTTLTYAVDDTEREGYENCNVNWEQNLPLKTLVYNKKFKEDNFGKGKLDGVFTLGTATKEDIEIINEKNAKLKEIKEQGKILKEYDDTITSQITQETDRFKESSWISIFKKHEANFREAFTGSLTKEGFKSKLLSEKNINKASLETLDSLVTKAKTIFGEPPKNIEPITLLSFQNILDIENNPIWHKIIIGKADVEIAKLIQKLNNTDWVNEGRDYIQEDKNTCPFCQEKTITDDFRKQLESFFDEEYTRDIELLKKLKQDYFSNIDALVNLLDQIEKEQKELKESKLDITTFSASLKTITAQANANKKSIESKLKEPSRKTEVNSMKEQLDIIESIIAEANGEIKIHNDILLNYHLEKQKVISGIWKYILEDHKTEIDGHIGKITGLNKSKDLNLLKLKTKRDEYSTLDSEIKHLTKNVTSIEPTINEINRLLKHYGFLNFNIVESREEKGFYQIQREDGTIAETTLSEGEITFITFLYYLQLAKGSVKEDNINEDRILVIDDPVSSLDSNVLFVVSTLIKDIIKNIKEEKGPIKQLILLTHNVYFHKEVAFIDGRTEKLKNTNYWILRKNNKVSTIQAYFMENPIKSSYELLWKELKESGENSGITIQNIMRRIIENYFKLLGKYGDDELIEKFESVEEQQICRSLISWVNDGSHSINDDLFIEMQDKTIESYKEVFKKIFVLTNHEGHYEMMMQGVIENEELKIK